MQEHSRLETLKAPIINSLVLLLAILMLAPTAANATNPVKVTSAQLGELFNKSGVNGTFVLCDISGNRCDFHNQVRAETRFIPASTFKIPNSLIGLASGAVSDVDEVLPYGGEPQFLKIWEQDMGLREAIRISNVPVYQELARRIGLETMREYLALLDYGNEDPGTIVDRFWLQGPLKISAFEQTQFLARLAQGRLPLPPAVQRSVREIVQVKQGKNWTMYAKTGWTTTPNPDIGWWVGWVEKDKRIFSFALNIDMPSKGDAAKRVQLGQESLRLLRVID